MEGICTGPKCVEGVDFRSASCVVMGTLRGDIVFVGIQLGKDARQSRAYMTYQHYYCILLLVDEDVFGSVDL